MTAFILRDLWRTHDSGAEVPPAEESQRNRERNPPQKAEGPPTALWGTPPNLPCGEINSSGDSCRDAREDASFSQN